MKRRDFLKGTLKTGVAIGAALGALVSLIPFILSSFYLVCFSGKSMNNILGSDI